MGVYGGRYGVLKNLGGVRNWVINDEQAAAQFVNSAVAAGTGRRQGVNSWTGGYGNHGAVPPLMPGAFANFEGYTAPASGVLGSSGNIYTGQIIVDGVSILWDWASGQVISNQSQFSGTGALTSGSTASDTDATVSDPQPIGAAKITYAPASGGSDTTISNVVQANLNITCANQPYVTSSTSGNTGRVAGIFDWNASLVIDDDVLYSQLTKGTSYIFKFFIDATTYYELKWGLVISATNLTVAPEGGQVIQYTLNLGMNGTTNLAGTPTQGHIKLPAGTILWGV